MIWYLLLILLGGPTAMVGPFLVARHLVYRHAEQYGPAIRAGGRDDVAEPTVRALSKELSR